MQKIVTRFSCPTLAATISGIRSAPVSAKTETNLKVIQEIMGHADISTTMDVYAEATQEKKKASMTALQSALLIR